MQITLQQENIFTDFKKILVLFGLVEDHAKEKEEMEKRHAKELEKAHEQAEKEAEKAEEARKKAEEIAEKARAAVDALKGDKK